MKILLAEDDQNISTIAKLTLEQMGQHEVDTAFDGETALSMALENTYDLILLDEMMPKKSGLVVCQEYKEQTQTQAPIIFMSAKSQTEDIEKFQSNADGLISKPFDPTQLCQQIEDILKAKEVS